MEIMDWDNSFNHSTGVIWVGKNGHENRIEVWKYGCFFFIYEEQYGPYGACVGGVGFNQERVGIVSRMKERKIATFPVEYQGPGRYNGRKDAK